MAADEGSGPSDGSAPGGLPSGAPARGYGPPPGYGPAPGYPPPPAPGYAPASGGLPAYGQAGMRTSSADRERATDLLKAAFGEGRLTMDEFSARCARVMNARTYGDLFQVVADLPGGSAFGPPGAAAARYPDYRPPTSSLAIGSLVCGMLEFLTLGLAGIPAVILGHMAHSDIRKTGKSGSGMATAGLILGYLAVGLWALLVVVAVAG